MTTLLRDVIDIPERIDPNDLVMDISAAFDATADAIRDYVVTDQLYAKLDEALEMVRSAVQTPKSRAAYLHGSFGSGKSHFMTIVHALLNGDPAARGKPKLQPLIGKHKQWIDGKSFLLVPYHLVGAESLDAAVLSGYVKRVRELHPDAPTPPVYRDDLLLVNAVDLRRRMGEEAFIAALPGRNPDAGWDDDESAGEEVPWTSGDLDGAFAAPPRDPLRDELVSALLDSLLSAYRTSVHGDRTAFVPLETGLSAISRHAKELGYDSVVLFLDELILWLSSHLANLEFVNTEANKLVKLIESGDSSRPVPIVSFIARQRDIGELIGKDVAGAEVASLEDTIRYLERSFATVALADNNLPDIAQERVLKARDDHGRKRLDEAFAQLPRDRAEVWDALLDSHGLTHADAEGFRKFYPFSPALINTLIAISGALQRERTGLKVLREMLIQRRNDLTVGQLIPLGDLWDVLADGAVQPFSNRLKYEFEAAQDFYQRKAKPFLLAAYGLTQPELSTLPHQHQYRVDDRLIKTLLLAALAPDVSALKRLTAGRLAALNHGSIRTRVEGTERSKVIDRLKELAGHFGEIRYSDAEDPVFTLHLTGIDVEKILGDLPPNVDTQGGRRALVKDLLWDELGVADRESFNPHLDVVWRGTKRTIGLIFGNVRDPASLSDGQFEINPPEQARIIFDYPFDKGSHSPQEDLSRVGDLQQRGVSGPVISWLPSFLSDQRQNDLGRLLRLRFLLETPRRLDEYAADLPSDQREKARNQLEAMHTSLTRQLREVLKQAYGILRASPANIGAEADEHVICLDGAHRPQLHAGVRFSDALLYLTDSLFSHLHPKHPDFDPSRSRTAIRPTDLRAVLEVVTAVAAEGGRAEVEKGPRRTLMRRIAHPLRLGEMVTEAHFVLSQDWRQRINQWAAQAGRLNEIEVKDLLRWFEQTELNGADRLIHNLVVATYALSDNRAWIKYGSRAPSPALDGIDGSYGLRTQELPDTKEFETALTRAQHLFAVQVKNVYSAPNVGRLAAVVRGQAETAEPATMALVRSLERHAHDLGIDPNATEGRLATARSASDLLAKIQRIDEPSPLVCLLASEILPAGDAVVGTSIGQATTVDRAIADVDWNLLVSLRELADREGTIGERAGKALKELFTAAAADELTQALPPVLKRVRAQAISLLGEASRTPVSPGPIEQPTSSDPQPISADDVHITIEPSRGRNVRRVRAAELDHVIADLRQVFVQWPDHKVEITWRVVGEE
jgi:hypothetical protein